jgi:CRP/FNR family cyclic AMP-dependent transcriptional regulator
MGSDTETTIVSARAIRESPLGIDLNDTQCRALAEVAGAVGLETGTVLLEEGHVDETLYVVSSGSLEVMLHAGDMAGILGFVDGVPHSAGIRALTRCELIELDRKDLEHLLEQDPQIAYQVMRAVVRAAHRILGKMNAQFVEMSNYISHQHGRY